MTPTDHRQDQPDRRSGPFVTWLVAQHRWVVPLLAVLALLGIASTVVSALGFAPLDTTGTRLTRVEGQVSRLVAEYDALTASISLIPIIFCRDATIGERALVRDRVDCQGLYPSPGGPR